MGGLASLHDHRDEILHLASTFKARNVRVFGSVSRGDDHDGSDIDLLVTWEEEASLNDWAGFRNILAHGYPGGIDAPVIRNVIADELPPLKSAILAGLSRQP